MFGLDTIKLAVVGGLVLSTLGAGYAVYHGIQAAAASKIELQQAKLVAAAQHEQDQRSIEGLQQSAALAANLTAQLAQLKEAIHAVPVTRACLSSPAGRAFSQWVRTSGIPGAAAATAAGSMAVPGAAAHPR
jgi:hypothetical protein